MSAYLTNLYQSANIEGGSLQAFRAIRLPKEEHEKSIVDY